MAVKVTPAITLERKHFSKIYESRCKALSSYACSYLYRVSEVSDGLCRTNDKPSTGTVTLSGMRRGLSRANFFGRTFDFM